MQARWGYPQALCGPPAWLGPKYSHEGAGPGGSGRWRACFLCCTPGLGATGDTVTGRGWEAE